MLTSGSRYTVPELDFQIVTSNFPLSPNLLSAINLQTVNEKRVRKDRQESVKMASGKKGKEEADERRGANDKMGTKSEEKEKRDENETKSHAAELLFVR